MAGLFAKTRVLPAAAGSATARLLDASRRADDAVTALATALADRREAISELASTVPAGTALKAQLNGALAAGTALRCTSALSRHVGSSYVSARHASSFGLNARMLLSSLTAEEA